MTLGQITEEVKKAISRSFSDKNYQQTIADAEIRHYIAQATNEILAIEPRQQSKVGTVDIPHSLIATYTGVTVATASAISSVTLPATPMPLPHNMGVWAVYPEQGTNKGAYIPIDSGMWDLIGGLDEGLLENQIGWLAENKRIIFTKDLSAQTTPITSVKVKLLIFDLAQYLTTDNWPVGAGMEMQIVERVLAFIKDKPVRQTELKADGAAKPK